MSTRIYSLRAVRPKALNSLAFRPNRCLFSTKLPIKNKHSDLSPNSFKNSKPLTTKRPPLADKAILKSIENAVSTGQIKKAKLSIVSRIAFFTIPFILFAGGYVVYSTYQDKPAFFPVLFTKTLPLEKAKGIEKVDLNKLQDRTKDFILSRLSMNTEIKRQFGLPLKLGEFEKFQVTIEYQNFTVEGFQVDCTRHWLPPDVTYCQREIVKLPENLNKFLEPLGTDGAVELDSLENQFPNAQIVRDYNIIIRGRIAVLDSDNSRIDPGTGCINFVGVIEFDHTKTIKLVSVILSYKENGDGVVKKLW